MKKLIFAVFAVALTFNAFGQISIGIRGGINLANQSSSGDGSISTDNITGLNIAIPIEIGITEAFSVQPELTYLQKGSGFSLSLLGVTSETKSTYNYFELPILAKYKFVNTETLNVYAVAGPSFGYALGGKVTSKVTGVPGEPDVDESVTVDFGKDEYKDFNRFDLGLNFGAGLGFAVGPGSVILDIRYLLGLSDLDGSEGNTEIKNTGIGISAGYLYTIGGE